MIFMILLFLITSFGAFVLKFFFTGLSVESTFQGYTLVGFLSFLLLLCITAIIGGLIITLPFKYESIVLFDECLVGRSKWNFKKSIPYSKIKKIDRHSRILHEQAMIDGGDAGKVHISTHIENLETLISLLEEKIEQR